MTHRRKQQKGVSLFLTATALIVLALFMGLAVDAGTAFVIKGRLSAAVDAAALGAGRSLNLGITVAEAQLAASSAGVQFFLANFPDRFMGTAPLVLNNAVATNNDVYATFTQELDSTTNVPNGIVTVAVSGQVRAPLYFMRLLGYNNITIRSTGRASRRGLAMVLLLDKSGSMSGTPCADMKSAAVTFVGNFGPYDSIGLVTFGDSATHEYQASTSWKTGNVLVNKINAISCGGSTNTTSGLREAYRQLTAAGGVQQKLALNTIVIFTDGMPNGINANFPVRTQADVRYGWDSSGPAAPCGPGVQCNIPAVCTTVTTVRGMLSQQNQFKTTGNVTGLKKPVSTDSAATYPAECSAYGGNNGIKAMIAYIPNSDLYGNSTLGFKTDWLFHANTMTAPMSSGLDSSVATKDIGLDQGAGSNFNKFTAGPYAGFLRPDNPNAIGAASMNSAEAQAQVIRADSDYRIQIHSIYLLSTNSGGAANSDPVVRDFLPRVSNLKKIPPLPYEPAGTPDIDNPAYNPNQQTGQFAYALNTGQLTGLFQSIASSLLRISQ